MKNKEVIVHKHIEYSIKKEDIVLDEKENESHRRLERFYYELESYLNNGWEINHHSSIETDEMRTICFVLERNKES